VLQIAIAAILVQNFVLAKFLGLCPFIGVTKRTDSAFGMGMAVTFVMTLASGVTHFVYEYVLRAGPHNVLRAFVGVDQGMELVLKTVSYILVIAVLVQLVEMFLRKSIPALYRALGIYLPIITTNCAILGVVLLNTTDAPEGAAASFAARTFRGFCAGLGFTLVMLLMAGVRERLERIPVPRAMRGAPVAFICTGLMALAFSGFAKLFGIAG
jgi:electron transport complex protein RnfA